ncbi:MAG: thermonuclease family protein [Pseudomonadota bacterium]
MSLARSISGALLAAIILTTGPVRSQDSLSGTPLVLAGDLLELSGQRLRLVGIDAPKPGQQCLIKTRLYDCGKVSATALMDLTAGVEISCDLEGPADADGARPARCLADDYDLSEGMVYTGWALADPEVGRRYVPFQTLAEAKQHGLWKGRFITPWDWAQGERLPEEQNDQEG